MSHQNLSQNYSESVTHVLWLKCQKFISVSFGGVQELSRIVEVFGSLVNFSQEIVVGKIEWGVFGRGVLAIIDLSSNPTSQ